MRNVNEFSLRAVHVTPSGPSGVAADDQVVIAMILMRAENRKAPQLPHSKLGPMVHSLQQVISSRHSRV